MPLGRKHLRRNRDAPILAPTVGGCPANGTLGIGPQRTASNLSRTRREVNVPKELDAGERDGEPRHSAVRQSRDIAQTEQSGICCGQS